MSQRSVFKRICQAMFLTLVSAFSLHAAPAAGENMVVNPFRKELIKFNGVTIEPHGGRNGTPALVISTPVWNGRPDYKYYNLPLEGVKPLGKYRFGAWIKTKNVVPGYRGATMGLTFYHPQGRPTEGPFPHGIVGTKDDWTYFEYEVTAPAKEFTKVELNFYIGFEGTGTAIYSDPFFIQEAPVWKTTMIYPAMRYSVEPKEHTFEFNSYTQNLDADKEKQAKVAFVNEDGDTVFEDVADIKDHRYQVTANLPEGKYTAKLTLLPANINSEFSVNVVAPRDHSMVKIDEKGRFIVNGKPFLPVGIFTNQEEGAFKPFGHTWRQFETDHLIVDTPFNVLLPYDGTWLKFEDAPDLSKMDAALRMLDLLHEHDKMLMLSLKDFHPARINRWENIDGPLNITQAIVERMQDHPALLAWYMNDEQEVREYELSQVELVGQLDPYHPTVQCQYGAALQYTALNGGDVPALDIYPIYNPDSNQAGLVEVFEACHKAYSHSHGMSLMAIPQAFAWRVFTDGVPTYYPTLPQMRSATLMMAALGSKGFIFFSYGSVFVADKTFPERNFEERWKDVCALAQTVRDLEDYILSDNDYVTPEMQVVSGEPVVRVLTSNAGKQAVIVTTVGKGKTDVIIQLDANRKYQSKYGMSKDLGNGKWQFTCDFMNGDVIEEL